MSINTHYKNPKIIIISLLETQRLRRGLAKGFALHSLTLGQKQSLESMSHLHSPKVTSYLFNPTARLPCSYFNLKIFHLMTFCGDGGSGRESAVRGRRGRVGKRPFPAPTRGLPGAAPAQEPLNEPKQPRQRLSGACSGLGALPKPGLPQNGPPSAGAAPAASPARPAEAPPCPAPAAAGGGAEPS